MATPTDPLTVEKAQAYIAFLSRLTEEQIRAYYELFLKCNPSLARTLKNVK